MKKGATERSGDRLDRRSLLRGALALGGAASFLGGGPFARPRARSAAASAGSDRRVLVLIQLSGGNDGLSTVVPYADDGYHAARSLTALAPSEVLKLDDYRGLHPSLPRLHRRYQDGGLAIVEGVGYPSPNRSHFKSLDIWHAADERGRHVPEGWIGRLCREEFGEAPLANRVVHIGGAVPYSLQSVLHPPAAFASPASYRWMQNSDAILAADPERPSGNAALDLLRSRAHDAQSSSDDIRSVAFAYRTPVPYPDSPLGRSLRVAASLVHGDIGTRVISTVLGSFDTHVDQVQRHGRLMDEFDGGLGAFLEDLERTDVGRQAVVLVFSEFGRRVQENGSRGTDHGAAGPMFVAGARVKGGLHGEHPSLSELVDGDLAHNTDFRSVYRAAIEACFDVSAARVLGSSYPELDLFA